MKKLIYLLVFLPLLTFGQQTEIFELNQKLGKGINMGNMFEAPTETEWAIGNSSTAIRIPKLACTIVKR
jgi:hypothetical protein